MNELKFNDDQHNCAFFCFRKDIELEKYVWNKSTFDTIQNIALNITPKFYDNKNQVVNNLMLEIMANYICHNFGYRVIDKSEIKNGTIALRMYTNAFWSDFHFIIRDSMDDGEVYWISKQGKRYADIMLDSDVFSDKWEDYDSKIIFFNKQED